MATTSPRWRPKVQHGDYESNMVITSPTWRSGSVAMFHLWSHRDAMLCRGNVREAAQDATCLLQGTGPTDEEASDPSQRVHFPPEEMGAYAASVIFVFVASHF
jgi:hypothetical protein